MIESRRKFLCGLGASVIAAPAIVRASSLMAVKSWRDREYVGKLISVGISADTGELSMMIEMVNKQIFDMFAIPPPHMRPRNLFGTGNIYKSRPFLEIRPRGEAEDLTNDGPPSC